MEKPHLFKLLLGNTRVDITEKGGTISRHFEFALYRLGLTKTLTLHEFFSKFISKSFYIILEHFSNCLLSFIVIISSIMIMFCFIF